MTSYEIASTIIAGAAIVISIISLSLSIATKYKNKKCEVFVELKKYLIKFLDKKLQPTCTYFFDTSLPNSSVNAFYLDKLDGLTTELRKKFKNYEEFIEKKTFDSINDSINNFEDSYLELRNTKSKVNIDSYENNIKELKKALHSFLKAH